MRLEFSPIGYIRSAFKEKFGIPRQPGLVPAAEAVLEVVTPYNRREAFEGLDGFSHIWIVWVFHGLQGEAWKPTVRPPRLGGNVTRGVFASRSPLRPNPIGLSVVKLERVERAPDGIRLHLSGVDMLDGTPVLDVKPYLPYVDAVTDAQADYAGARPQAGRVVDFSDHAAARCREEEQRGRVGLSALLVQILSLDPRPAYQATADNDDKIYGTRLFDLDVKWTVHDGRVIILDLESL